MQLLENTQLYIMNPSLLIQFYAADQSLLIFGPLVLACIVFAAHLVFYVWYKSGDILKLNFGDAILSVYGAIKKGTKGSWITPLTSIGGVLGILLLLQTSALFTQLSALFGIILLFAPLVPKVFDVNKYSACLGDALSTILTLWAVFGELFAAIIFLAGLNLSSHLITIAIRIVVFLCIGLTLAYVCKWHMSQRSQKKTTATKVPVPVTDGVARLVEAPPAPELSRLR